MNRSTYIEINLSNIKHNIQQVIQKYSGFCYYFGVAKADCYGHGIDSISSMIDGGINYLVVATLEEALEVRKLNNKIPILCLGIVKNENIQNAIQNDITISISSLEYLNTIDISNLKGGKVHIKVNTGMNRLGVSTKEEFMCVYDSLTKNDVYIEGLYSHIYEAGNDKLTKKQYDKFEQIINQIDISNIKIIHIQASEAITKYPKKDYINGCRLGIIMYGFSNDKNLELKSTFKVLSEVIQVNTLIKGDTVGYDGAYVAKEDIEKIAVIPIGYADGIIRKNTLRYVYINGKRYQIVGNICMDMLFVKVDNSVKLFDSVEVLKDIKHISEVANYLKTIPYEVICSLGKRVPRIYTK